MDEQLKEEEESMKKEMKQKIKLFVYISWAITLSLSFKDGSVSMTKPVFLNISYQQWLIFDSCTTLILLFGLILDKFIWCKSQEIVCFDLTIRELLQKILEVIGFLIGLFKYIWMIFGLVIFLSIDYAKCTMILKTYSTIYFETFLYFTVRSLALLLNYAGHHFEKKIYERDLKNK